MRASGDNELQWTSSGARAFPLHQQFEHHIYLLFKYDIDLFYSNLIKKNKNTGTEDY